MDIEQIKRFVAVADSGSYIRAAEQLNVAQPTLSRQIRALELELRTPLFHRHGRGIVLTAQGKIFLEHARSILHSVEVSLHALAGEAQDQGGRVVIGLTPTIGRVLIPSLCNDILDRFPKASISFIDGMSGVLLERALIGQVDFAIVHNPPATTSLHVQPLTSEPLFLVGKAQVGTHPKYVSLRDAAALPMILSSNTHPVRSAVETEAARQGLRINVRVEVDSYLSILDLVRREHGYTVVPKNLHRTIDGADLCWQQLIEPEIQTTLCLVTQTRWNRLPVVSHAIDAAARLFHQAIH